MTFEVTVFQRNFQSLIMVAWPWHHDDATDTHFQKLDSEKEGKKGKNTFFVSHFPPYC